MERILKNTNRYARGQRGGIDFDVRSYYSRPHTYVIRRVFKRHRCSKRAGVLPPYVHRLWNPTACYRPRGLGYQWIDTDNDEFGQQISLTTKKNTIQGDVFAHEYVFCNVRSFFDAANVNATLTYERTDRPIFISARHRSRDSPDSSKVSRLRATTRTHTQS